MDNFVSTKPAAALSRTLLDFPRIHGQVVTEISEKCVCVCVHSIQMKERLHITNIKQYERVMKCK